ncbi:MAG TPA: efflux RND transporter periplasmic adaptor subunit [Chthoniobacteraceae bacterium]|nr:efflux RND transporter periplasmic adaptor subunit [Chthoniobacteraceae bacterium]
MNYHRRKFLRVFSASCGAVLLGACSRRQSSSAANGVDYYTCTMHTSVRSPNPGKCPFCGMELVAVMKNGAAIAAGPVTFTVPPDRQQQIGVTYALVERKPLHHVIRAVGVIQPDKLKRWEFVARVDGYVKTLHVASAGEVVERDQPLLSLYSPELLTTEREFVMLLRMRDEAATKEARGTPEDLIAAAKARLRQWNVTDSQIEELEKTRQPSDTITLLSPFRGIVEAVSVEQGRNVKTGDVLVDVVDISTVWAFADFYENELSMLQKGQKVTVTAASYPSEKFEGAISVIDPFIDEVKRTAKVRIDIPNPDFKLHPSMYVNVEYPMDMGEGLAIPVSAVMPTGLHSVVFVDKGEGRLEPRDVKLGTKYGDIYEVLGGLSEGERVVASANFLIDAESKVQGALDSFQGSGSAEGGKP